MIKKIAVFFISFSVFGLEKIAPEDIIDVAIVGAGVSGTYAGWRLTNIDPKNNQVFKDLIKKPNDKLRVMLFEMNNRIGGRLWSIEVMPGLIAEIGGMRFLDSQLFVKSLVNHLGLEIVPFPSNIANGFQYLRGQRIWTKDFQSKFFKLPYNLRENEQGKTAANLLEDTLRSLPEVEKLKFGDLQTLVKFWKESVVFGEPIYKWGMWNLLAKKLSFEAIAYIKEAAGYDDFYENINAAASISLIASTGGLGKTVPVYHALKRGYDSLPKTLAKKFVEQGGKVLLDHQLISVQCVNYDSQVLMQILVDDQNNNKKHTYYARHLILAMPRKSLELLDQKCFIFKDKQFIRNIASVGRVVASKLFLLYDKPWWKKLGFDSGRSTTDLPIRQCYYLKPVEEKKSGPEYSLLMASYSDGESSDYWKSYLPIAALEDEANELVEDCPPHNILGCLDIPVTMKNEINRQLKILHGFDIPSPVKAIFHSWKISPFGGGLHRWNPQVQPWIVIKSMRHPIKNIPLYIMGDSFSVIQNWVEGALTSSELVLRESFHLNPPEWLDSKYNLGP